MTLIADFPTKKAFREAVARGEVSDLYDPSFFTSNSYPTLAEAAAKRETVTNHPKRSWFAALGIDAKTGQIKVS